MGFQQITGFTESESLEEPSFAQVLNVVKTKASTVPQAQQIPLKPSSAFQSALHRGGKPPAKPLLINTKNNKKPKTVRVSPSYHMPGSLSQNYAKSGDDPAG